MSKGYLWYSANSDETGAGLAKLLGFDSGKKTPKCEDYDVILSWGAKAGTSYKREKFDQRVGAGQLRLINSVEAIAANKDRLSTLRLMKERGVSVPGFVLLPNVGVTNEPARQARMAAVFASLKIAEIAFPILGYIEDRPVICYTEEDVIFALKGPNGPKIAYFRSFCPGTEFRIHVFRDLPMFAQKKVLAKDPVKACTDSVVRSLRRRRNQDKALQAVLTDACLNPAAVRAIVVEVAGDALESASPAQKSLSRGWELQSVNLENVAKEAKDQAVLALDAVGLDLGAVSVEVDGKTVRVTSVTTGPALSEQEMGIYAKHVKQFCDQKQTPAPKAVPAVVPTASSEIRAKLARRIEGLSPTKAERLLALLEED